MKTAEPRTVTPAIQRKAAGPFFGRGGNSFFDQDTVSKQDSFFRGNSARTSSVNGSSIQAKLSVGKPDDKYEKEADAVADKVVQRLTAPELISKKETWVQTKPLAAGITPLVQRKCASCEQENKLQEKEEENGEVDLKKLQRKPIFESNSEPPDDEGNVQRKCTHCEEAEKLQKSEGSGDSSSASPDIENKLNSFRGSGSLLPETARSQLESSFGADFSEVRLHTDSSAVEMSKDLNAQAFTLGNDIYFNAGKFDTNSNAGRHLLAHELTHTIQQGGVGLTLNKLIQKNGNAGPSVKSLPVIESATLPASWTKTNLPISNGKDVFVYRGVANDASGKLTGGILAEADAAAGGVVSRLTDAAHDAIYNQYGREPVLTGPKAGGIVRIRIPSSIWDELVKTNNISERSYPGFSRALNSSEIRINSAEAIRIINSLQKDVIPPDPFYDFRPGKTRPSAPKPIPEAPSTTVPGEVPPTEFKVQSEYKILNNSKIPGSNNTVIEVETILGEGLDSLNKTATSNNATAIPKRMIIRITISPEGALVGAESAAGETNPLVQFLAKRAVETVPKTTGVSPWVRGAGWAGLIIFIGATIYRYNKASEEDKPRVLAQSGGGFVGGMVAGYVVCNLILGIETLGWSLLICGVLVGIPGGIAGEAIADVAYDEATIDDDEIREHITKSNVEQIRILPFAEKIRMIFSLMKGWVSDEDVSAIVRICNSINNNSELKSLKAIIEPQLINLSSIGQRTRVRVALARRIQMKAMNNLSNDPEEKQADLMANRVVQQGNTSLNISRAGELMINRSVNNSSTCDSSVDASAPPAPLFFIQLTDTMAGMHLSMAKMKLSLDLMNPNGIPSGDGFDAYRRRFGDPPPLRNKFRNRFNGTVHDTLVEGQASEMRSLINVLDAIDGVLTRDIDYRCIGPNVRQIGRTVFDCANTGFSLISRSGVNRIVICPAFWALSPDQRAIGLIHEAVHINFGFGDHDTAPFAQSANQRRTEPECYASMVADLNGVQPFDPSCPSV